MRRLSILSLLFLSSLYPSAFSTPNGVIIFGDSFSDTGASINIDPSNPANYPPFGKTYPGSPTGRFSDGKLIIDYLGDAMKFGYPEPYFATINPDYSRSINFAQGGATALDTVFLNPIYLSFQLQQFLQFKQRVLTGYNSNRGSCNGSLPPANFYETFLYVIEIGAFDLMYTVVSNNRSLDYITNTTIPQVVAAIKSALQLLHDNGGRNFLVFTIPPIGCNPFLRTIYATPNPAAYDAYNCLIGFNNVAQYFNSNLTAAVISLRTQFNDSTFYIADMYSPYYQIVSNNGTYGFTNTQDICCGNLNCGTPGVPICSNPNTYINWDGIHYTQQYYQDVANFFLNGTFVDPAFT